MKYVYFDTSVYNKILDAQATGPMVKERLKNEGLSLIFSQWNMFELASTGVMGRKDIVRCTNLFQLIKELLPLNFLPAIPNLIATEINHIINKRPKDIFVKGQNRANFEMNILEFSKGNIRRNAINAIEKKWGQKKEGGFLAWLCGNLYRQEEPNIKNMSFQHFLNSERDELKDMLVEIIHRLLPQNPLRETKKTSKRILSNISKCPVIRATLRAKQFAIFRAQKQEQGVSQDTWDDLTHAILSSYASLFVTAEKGGLCNYFNDIQPEPEIKIQQFDDFWTYIHLSRT